MASPPTHHVALADLRPPNPHDPASRERTASPDREATPVPMSEEDEPIDWPTLKALHERARKAYYDRNTPETTAAALLRPVLAGCVRLQHAQPDPTTAFYCPPPPASTPRPFEHSSFLESPTPGTPLATPSHLALVLPPTPPQDEPQEPITAFHTVHGTALVHFGSLVMRNPALAGDAEGRDAMAWYLAAADAFERGREAETARKGGGGRGSDWEFEVAWGTALARMAEYRLLYPDAVSTDQPSALRLYHAPPHPHTSSVAYDRVSGLAADTPQHLLTLADDHLQAGLLHLPAGRLPIVTPTPTTPLLHPTLPLHPTPASSPPPYLTRAYTLHTLVALLLHIASLFPPPPLPAPPARRGAPNYNFRFSVDYGQGYGYGYIPLPSTLSSASARDEEPASDCARWARRAAERWAMAEKEALGRAMHSQEDMPPEMWAYVAAFQRGRAALLCARECEGRVEGVLRRDAGGREEVLAQMVDEVGDARQAAHDAIRHLMRALARPQHQHPAILEDVSPLALRNTLARAKRTLAALTRDRLEREVLEEEAVGLEREAVRVGATTSREGTPPP